MSFSYDKALVNLTGMDRLNPRLIDITVALIVLLRYKQLINPVKSEFVSIFSLLLSWMFVCVFFWSFFIPDKDIVFFSWFYLIKYFEVFIVLRFLASVNYGGYDLKQAYKLLLVCGLLVSGRAFVELVSLETEYVLSTGKIVYHRPGTLMSWLGSTYHHLTFYASLMFSLNLAVISTIKSRLKIFIVVMLTLLTMWPMLFSGARTGIVGLFFMLGYFFLKDRRVRRVILSVLIFFVFLLATNFSAEDVSQYSSTLQRVEEFDSNYEQSVTGRLSGRVYDLSLYSWQGPKMFLFGGGFYVVPHLIDSTLKYRVGYGVHNSYLFPFEQGGIVMFIFSLILYYSIWKRIIQKSYCSDVNSVLLRAGRAYFLFQMLSGFVGGNTIWMSVGMETMTFMSSSLYLLLEKSSNNVRKTINSIS